MITTTRLPNPTRTKNGKYIVDGFKISSDGQSDWALVRNVGWCKFSNKLSAIYIPNVGWVVY